MDKIFDLLILGGGPAGLSAALYGARAGLHCAIVDKSAIGGAPSNYCEIENYLGFDKINGFELCEKFENHIDNFEIEKFPYEEIEELDLVSNIKKIITKERILRAKTVVIATGSKAKKLGIKGEIENIGKGVSYCAVCDGAFYKDKTTAVVGGGNSALEEALYLARFCSKVYLIHRRDKFRADDIIQKRIKNNNKIELILNAVPEEIISDENKVTALKIQDLNTQKTRELKLQGVFPYIGLEPASKMFCSQVLCNEQGFIKTDINMQTNVKGVFAAGDVRNTPLRQVITAVADGAIAGVQAGKYIECNNTEGKIENESACI